MADALISNPITLRGCILYEFIEGKEPFETFKKLMKKLGNEFMTYPEFEFWYMRFAQGNFDLDYDFSLEPKKRQITDLPVEIFEKVGDSLYFEDRAQLRNVSKDIQFRVDNWNPKVTKFTYHCYECWDIVLNSETYDFYSKDRRRPNPLSAVVRILKNPKLRLHELSFELLEYSVAQDSGWLKIEEELRKSSTKLHVNHLTLEESRPIDFRLFAPESLEEITFYIDEENVNKVKKINEIVNPEHCQQLKMLKIRTNSCLCAFPPNSFFGFPRFTIDFYGTYCLGKVVDCIKKLIKWTQWELCILEWSSEAGDPQDWEPIIENLLQIGTSVPDRPNVRRYPIRGSSNFYEIDIEEERISIERKS
ncbi:hypothetical protein CRE_11422 [Caenorhabditis remanei]|uniref:F-box domain-containing protein n=1 Tax=Caenorhabditis remanei TaxID=31234 RepID=E3NBD2_CAERE|nr:hypothetical protein CRE_11422 [Caenorhabditis remanei]